MFYGSNDSRDFYIAYETKSVFSALDDHGAARAEEMPKRGAAMISILLTTVCLNSGDNGDLQSLVV